MVKFEAPKGTQVFWGEAKIRNLKNPTTINTSVQWDERDPESFLHRYAEGDTSLMRKGSWIVSYGVEQKGGPAHEDVKRFLAENGETREPTPQEVVDWTLVNFGSNPPPIGKPDGTKGNPIPVKDPRYPHGHIMEVKGKWYMNDLSPGSKVKGGFPVDDPDGGGKKDPNYQEIVSTVRARVQAVEVPSAGGKFAIQLRQLVNDLLAIVGKS